MQACKQSTADEMVVRSSVEQTTTFPTISGIAKKAMELASSPDTSLREMSEFIAQDSALVARLLKTINSVVYGFPRRISSVTEALLLLGLDVVPGLLLNLTVFDLMKEMMVGLWEHSAGCAIACRLIARKKGIKDPEEASIYGLLHDVGKTILLVRWPRLYERALEDAKVRDASIRTMEKRLFSIDHTMVGSWIAAQCRFPEKFIEVIKCHHAPQLAVDARVETAVAHLADIIVRARGFGFAGDNSVPAVDPAAWELLGLSESDLRDIFAEMEDLLEEIEERAR